MTSIEDRTTQAATAQGVFDADNHYYEARDAFTRHLDPAMAGRCVQWAEIDGRHRHVVGGRVSRAVSNPTFDPVARPGVLADYFRGNPDAADPLALLRDREPLRPEYHDRAARLAAMDAQGLAGCWMFPTLGMVYETPLRDDPEAVCATFRAFNRWVAEDWGFAHENRIYAAAYLTLADPQWAEAEVAWALDAGARLLVMLPTAPVTADGRRSPFDPVYDKVWGQIDEAGITVVLHAGDAGLSLQGYATDGFAASFSQGWVPSIKFFEIEQAIDLWLSSMLLAQLPVRFPNLRFAAVENGAEFLPAMFRKVRSVARKVPGWFADDPVDVFRQHVWVNPFWEDSIDDVIGWVGADRVLYGSDWPHIEGLPTPTDGVAAMAHLSDADRQAVLGGNAQRLTELAPRRG
ncbi:MAG: amidohydrolase family protein [Acidimicrobiia bacterium]|nr:amidohydrolase family protein [Acidimicrobiia bacterium]